VYVQKNRENIFVDHKPNQRVTDLITESEKAIKEGNSQQAYELSLQATQIDPENIEAWLLRATLAASLEERIICVNRLNELAPSHQDRYNVAYCCYPANISSAYGYTPSTCNRNTNNRTLSS